MNFASKKICLAVPFAVAAIGLASPAFAFEPASGSANSSETSRVQTSDASTSAPAAKKASAKKYCMAMEAATGSRMMTRECKTKAEWDMLGYDVSDKK